MKTLLSIGVFVAVIFWSSGKVLSIKCWSSSKDFVWQNDENGFEIPNTRVHACLIEGTGTEFIKTTKDNLKNCTQVNCGLNPCGRIEFVDKKKKITQITLRCVPLDQTCLKEEEDDLATTICKCDEELCNAGECKVEMKKNEKGEKKVEKCEMVPIKEPKEPKDNANGADGTSYTHLIIAFIIGAIFFL